MKLLMQVGMLLCFTIPTFSQDNRNSFFEYSNEKSLIKVENIIKTENGNLEIDLCFKNTSEKIFYPFVVSVGKNTQYGDNKSLYDKKNKTVSTNQITVNGSNVKIILTSKIKDFWRQKIYPKDSLKFKIETEINSVNSNDKFVIDYNYIFCSLNYNVTSTIEDLANNYSSREIGKIIVWPFMPKIFRPIPNQWYLVKSKNFDNKVLNGGIQYATFGTDNKIVLRGFQPFSQYYLNRLKEGEGTYLNGQRLSLSNGTLINYGNGYYDFILYTSNDFQDGKVYEQEKILKVSTNFSDEADELYITNEIAYNAPSFEITDEINLFYNINRLIEGGVYDDPTELKKYIDIKLKDSKFDFNKLSWKSLSKLFHKNVYKSEAAVAILNSKMLDSEALEQLVKCNCVNNNVLEEKAFLLLVSPSNRIKTQKFIELFPNSTKLSIAKENLKKTKIDDLDLKNSETPWELKELSSWKYNNVDDSQEKKYSLKNNVYDYTITIKVTSSTSFKTIYIDAISNTNPSSSISPSQYGDIDKHIKTLLKTYLRNINTNPKFNF